MITSTLLLSLLTGGANAVSAVDRRIAAPCSVVRERADQYFAGMHFRTGAMAGDTGASVTLALTKDALTPSGSLLSLNRSAIHRYTLHRRLSPMKSYTDFRLTGQIYLRPVSAKSCTTSLHFEFSAFEYVWSLAAIDDGYRSQFTSNGTLERGYLDSLAALFASTEEASQ